MLPNQGCSSAFTSSARLSSDRPSKAPIVDTETRACKASSFDVIIQDLKIRPDEDGHQRHKFLNMRLFLSTLDLACALPRVESGASYLACRSISGCNCGGKAQVVHNAFIVSVEIEHILLGGVTGRSATKAARMLCQKNFPANIAHASRAV